MIKFTALIHKETGTVIKYEDWKENIKTDTNFRIRTNDASCYRYSPFYCLTSDDFEIIYDSEFTVKELNKIYNLLMDNSDSCENIEIKSKIFKKLNTKEMLKYMHGIEV
jgi:hypothetical protein